MGKKITTNPKSVEARQRKDEKKRAEQERVEKAKEDAQWVDDDKLINRKLNRKEEQEKKKQETLAKKQENKQLYEEELKSLKGKTTTQKMTRSQIENTLEKERLEREKLTKEKSDQSNVDQIVLEENLNRIEPDQVFASNVDSAIEALSINETEKIEKHPEKRMKAAYTAFEETQMPILKKQNPTLRLSQIKQLLKKEWMKSPENPLNQAFKSYNSK